MRDPLVSVNGYQNSARLKAPTYGYNQYAVMKQLRVQATEFSFSKLTLQFHGNF